MSLGLKLLVLLTHMIPMKLIAQVFANKEFLMTFATIPTLQFQLFFLIMLANGDMLNLLPLSGLFH